MYDRHQRMTLCILPLNYWLAEMAEQYKQIWGGHNRWIQQTGSAWLADVRNDTSLSSAPFWFMQDTYISGFLCFSIPVYSSSSYLLQMAIPFAKGWCVQYWRKRGSKPDPTSRNPMLSPADGAWDSRSWGVNADYQRWIPKSRLCKELALQSEGDTEETSPQ